MPWQPLHATVTIIVAIIGVSTTGALADSSSHKARQPLRAAHHALHHHHGYARGGYGPDFRSGPAYGAPRELGWGGGVYHGPGFTFVPRHGIVDEACNLPTSACPNEYRDVR